jgi:hypothetical protein
MMLLWQDGVIVEVEGGLTWGDGRAVCAAGCIGDKTWAWDRELRALHWTPNEEIGMANWIRLGARVFCSRA